MSMNVEKARFNMIEQQIRPWAVLDQGVLSLLAVVKREDFVPAAYRSLAFVDMEVPLAAGRRMLAPKIEARLLQELGVSRHEKVLEIGTGSGYMAALLGHRAREVFTVEIEPELARMARANLERAAVKNVRVIDGDGVRDLLVGQFGEGILWIHRNEGTNGKPKLAPRVKFDGTVPTG